jgi:predicted 3-demethylubiquinone-9 3-methyltransferase (glyoxalase superfamily)
MSTITPCLWFNFNAEEAMALYTEVFEDSKVLSVSHYPDDTPEIGGKALMIVLELQGQEIQLLNGGPQYPHTPAISLSVSCDSAEQVDRYWDALVDGGEPSQCGWLADRFGVSWQIVPKLLGELLGSEDTEAAGRAMQAMLSMVKLDSAALQAAFDGTAPVAG